MSELKVDYFFNCYDLVVNVFPDFLYSVRIQQFSFDFFRKAISSSNRFY